MKQWELSWEQLKYTCDCSKFSFETTEDVAILQGIVGQEQAVESMEFGLKVKKYGYNIFITGKTGTGRSSYTKSMVQQAATNKETPCDWCYLANFEKFDQPRVLSLPAGKAVELQNSIQELIKQVMTNISQALSSEKFGKAKALLLQELQTKQNEILDKLNETGRELGFSLKNTEKGLITIPLNAEGKPMNEDEFKELDKEEAKAIEDKSKELNLLVIDVFKELQDLEKESQEQIDELESKFALNSIKSLFEAMAEKYQEYPNVQSFLQEIQDDIMKNLKEFKSKDEKSSLEMLLRHDRDKDFRKKYMINVLVDNSELQGAPVIVATNPTYYNLMGKVEYENQLGMLTTDYLKIKPGALHRANGGYLIIQCRDLFNNILAWQALKRALKTEKLYIENISEQLGIIPTSSIKPEPIPLNVKVILIGSYWEYQVLYHYDEDFQKLFKIKVEFDVEMNRIQDNELKMVQFIKKHCEQENLRHFTKEAVARIIEYSCRLADSKEKLSTRFNEILEVLYEADTWAELAEKDKVEEQQVLKAIREKIKRSNNLERKVREMVDKGDILIDLKKKVVGQVNGLAVIDLGEHSFGKPSRITVNTFVGKKGIINIEREAKLSGAIHDKGVLILSGYLGEKFGRKCPLSFSASICFEQNYSGIDGDSASSTELYGLLSSLSGVPIKQNIAVTGSVNQKGEVQPIGGVNQKIEGFYQVCKIKGLTGQQGVIIPEQNVKNLMLSDEVIESVKRKEFHIYAVKTIEEGIEILTDTSYREIFSLVQSRLREINDCVKKEDNIKNSKDNI